VGRCCACVSTHRVDNSNCGCVVCDVCVCVRVSRADDTKAHLRAFALVHSLQEVCMCWCGCVSGWVGEWVDESVGVRV